MSESIKRGDIYYADLSPVVGSEQDGVRPVLVVSNNIGNHTSKTVIVVPITSKPKNKHHIPTHVHIFSRFARLIKVVSRNLYAVWLIQT